MISKVYLNSKSYPRKKTRNPTFQILVKPRKNKKWWNTAMVLKLFSMNIERKGTYNGTERKLNLLYPCKTDTKVVKPRLPYDIFLYWRHDWVNTKRKVQTVSFQYSTFPSLIWHFALYTSMKIWNNKKNFSQTPLPPPALLDSLKLHFYFLGLQLLFPSDF